MRRNFRIRPSKGMCVMGFGISLVFIVVGVFLVIPMTFGSGIWPIGLFGVAWTGIAIYQAVTYGRWLFGKEDAAKGSMMMGGFEITEDEAGESAEARLKKLQGLYDQRLITTEEYEKKRQDILKEL